jgi:deoxyribonuclease-4
MAGQGSSLGSTLTELAHLYHALSPSYQKRLGICIDTCHAFAQGYAIDTETGYKRFWEEFQDKLGMKALGALHINDSLKPRGSKLDRHTHLGQGMLGTPFFWRIMQDNRFTHIPKILETPTDTLRGDVENLAFLHHLADKNAPPSY